MSALRIVFVIIVLSCAAALPVPLPPFPIAPSSPLPHATAGPIVNTTYGPVQGLIDTVTGDQVFFGIPFAAPPVGALRFASPQPPTAWSDVRPAQLQPASCPQAASFLYGSQAEDCLYLNVFAPANASNLPVMYFIYGGSFTSGGVSIFLYQGQTFAKTNNVVVVTVNYRLGVLGWLVHDQLSRENPSFPTSGNYGLKDQQLGLEWVRANIASFGGDPHAITIFGESAGAISVCLHMVVPTSAGLFSQSIMESGPCVQGLNGPSVTGFANYTHYMQQGRIVIDALHCQNSDPQLEIACLRDTPVSSIIAAQLPTQWSPVIDNFTVPADPLVLFSEGKVAPGNVIIGTNANEGTFFTPDLLNATIQDYQDQIAAQFPLVASKIMSAYPFSAYPGPGYALAAIFGDYFFMCPSRRLLRLLPPTNNGWQYKFNHVLSWVTCPGFWCSYVPLGVYHSSELFLVWNNAPPFSSFSPAEVTLSETMMRLWGSFAVTGEPQAPGVSWPIYSEQQESYLILNDTITVGSGYNDQLCDFWDSLLKM